MQRLPPGPLVLDGAMGTELERRGVATPAPLWSAAALCDAPQTVRQVHTEYAAAGADILVANTFRVGPRTLRRAGVEQAGPAWCELALRLAQQAAGAGGPANRPVLVAASVGPAEDCYCPQQTPAASELQQEHEALAAWLVRGGASLAWIETVGTVREGVAAARAARAAGLPFVLCWVTREDGALLGGEPLAQAVAAVAPLGPLALGLNCGPPRGLSANVRRLALLTKLPLAVYAHIDNRVPLPGWSYAQRASPAEYAEAAREWLDLGVAIVGGCCGTQPAHIAALREVVDRRRSRAGT